MKSPQIENIVVDEVHDLTYVVMAHKVLNDGELYSAIRVRPIPRFRGAAPPTILLSPRWQGVGSIDGRKERTSEKDQGLFMAF